jgi:hypothetical protein
MNRLSKVNLSLIFLLLVILIPSTALGQDCAALIDDAIEKNERCERIADLTDISNDDLWECINNRRWRYGNCNNQERVYDRAKAARDGHCRIATKAYQAAQRNGCLSE